MNAANAAPSAKRHWLADGTVALLLLLALVITSWLAPDESSPDPTLVASATHPDASARARAHGASAIGKQGESTGNANNADAAGNSRAAGEHTTGSDTMATQPTGTSGQASDGGSANGNGAANDDDSVGTARRPTEMPPATSSGAAASKAGAPPLEDNARPDEARTLDLAGNAAPTAADGAIAGQPLIEPTAQQLEIVEKLRKEAEIQAAQSAREEQQREQRRREQALAAEESKRKLARQREAELEQQELLASKALQQAISVHETQGAGAARDLYRDVFAQYGGTPSGTQARSRWEEVVALIEAQQASKNELLRQQRAAARDLELAASARREQASADANRQQQAARSNEQAAQSDQEAVAILAKGKQLQTQGRLEDAADQFKKILALHPRSAAAEEAGERWEGMRETLRERDAERQQKAFAQRQQQARAAEAELAQRAAAMAQDQQRLAEERRVEAQRQETAARERLTAAKTLLSEGKLSKAADAFKQIFSTYQDTAAANEALSAWQETVRQVKEQEKEQAEREFQALAQRRAAENEQIRQAQAQAAQARQADKQQLAAQAQRQRAARLEREQTAALQELQRAKKLRADGRLAEANKVFRDVLATYNDTPAAAEARQLWEETNAALDAAEAEQFEKSRRALAERREAQAAQERVEQARQAELTQQRQAELARLRIEAAKAEDAEAVAQLAEGKRLEAAGDLAQANDVYRRVIVNYPKASVAVEAEERRAATGQLLDERERQAQAVKLRQKLADQAKEQEQAESRRRAEAAAVEATRAAEAARDQLAQQQNERRAAQALAAASELELAGKLEEARAAYRDIVTRFRGTRIEVDATRGVLNVAKKLNEMQAEQARQASEASQRASELKAAQQAQLQEQRQREAAAQRETKAAAAFAQAKSLYDRNQVAAAEKAFEDVTQQYSGTDAAKEAQTWLRNLATARTVLQQTAAREAAEEKRQAEEAARKLRESQANAALAQAREDHAAKRFEPALERLDALLRDYAGTAAADTARSLKSTVQAEFKQYTARQAALEKEADGLLYKAKKLHDSGSRAAAKKEFEALIKKYPGTQAAKTAASYLAQK